MHRGELVNLVRRCFSDDAADHLNRGLVKARVTQGGALEKILFPNCYDMEATVRGVISVVQWNFMDASSLTVAYDTCIDACQLRLNGDQLVMPLAGPESGEARFDIDRWYHWGNTPQTVARAIGSLEGEIGSFAESILRLFRVYTVHLMLTSACALPGFTLAFNAARRDQIHLWNQQLMRVYGSMLGIQNDPFLLSCHAMAFATELFPDHV